MKKTEHNGLADEGPLPGNHERLLHLLEMTLQREAVTSESEELEQILLASDAARTLAVRFLNLQSLLDRFEGEPPAEVAELPWYKRFGLPGAAPAVASSKEAPPESSAALSEHIEPPRAAAPTRSSIVGFLSILSSKLPGGDATVGALIMLGIVGAFWGLAQLASHSVEQSKDAVTMRVSDDVRWPARYPKDGRTSVAQAEPLELEAGVVELRLPHGATLLVEGPARWSIVGDNAATLEAGRLVAHVPPGAVGFALTTPTARIVDLGTEFGVSVDGQRQSEVVVLKGAVRVEPQTRSSEHTPRAVTLSAGESVQVRSNGRNGLDVDRVRPTVQFTRSLDSHQRQRQARVVPEKGVLARSQIVVEDSGLVPVRTANESRFRAAEDDLLQTAVNPARPVIPPAETKGRFPGQELLHLFNGQLYPTGWHDFPLGRTEDSYSSPDESALEFYFDTLRAPRGYDLLRIESVTGAIRSRVGQRFVVSVRLVGEHEFRELLPVTVDIENTPVESNPASYERQVVISGPDGHLLATGVEAIRFELLKLDGSDPESVYREIDVFGAPTPAQ